MSTKKTNTGKNGNKKNTQTRSKEKAKSTPRTQPAPTTPTAPIATPTSVEKTTPTVSTRSETTTASVKTSAVTSSPTTKTEQTVPTTNSVKPPQIHKNIKKIVVHANAPKPNAVQTSALKTSTAQAGSQVGTAHGENQKEVLPVQEKTAKNPVNAPEKNQVTVTESRIKVNTTEKQSIHSLETSPHADSISEMFGCISKRYDLLNHILSLGLDFWWRYRLVNALVLGPTKRVLDIAAGTLDVSLSVLRTFQKEDVHVVAGDICKPMLENGKKKIREPEVDSITCAVMDAQAIPYSEKSFDAVTMAFGIRNVEDRAKALREMHRVLVPGGQLVIAEFCPMEKAYLGTMYHLYLEKVMPNIAALLGEKKSAYTYLAESIKQFPTASNFCDELKQEGFSFVKHQTLNFGLANLFIAIK